MLTARAAALRSASRLGKNNPRHSSTKTTSKKPVVWIARSYPTLDPCLDAPEFFIEMIKEHFDIIWYSDLKLNPELGKKVLGIVTNGLHYRKLLEQNYLMPNIKIVANIGAEYDHIPVDALASEGIWVTNTPNEGEAVADHAMALLLSSARAIVPSMQWMKQHDALHLNILGVDVSGATLGIVGLGSIGLKIAQRALGFNMKILYHQRSCKTKEEEDSLGGAAFYSRLQDMLPHCDFIVIACPLTTATENMFGAKEFSLMKPTAKLVNVARGSIVNHDALVSALKSGQIQGAALDVTDPEPLPPKHPLLEMENVVITPHAGTAAYGTKRNIYQICIDNLKAVLIDDTTPPNLIKPSPNQGF